MGWLAFGLAAALAAISFSGASAPAAEAAVCGAYRQSAHWGPLSHAAVEAYVAGHYGGDWTAYVAGLHDRLDAMRGAYRRGQVILYRRTGARLKGAALAAHVEAMAVRLAVTECLAGKAAAARRQAPTSAPVRQTSTVIGNALRLGVSSECQSDTVVFRIHNIGEKWPKNGDLKIFRLADQQVVARRNIRLGKDQHATYRVRRKAGEDAENRRLGLFIAPAWYQRPFTVDAVAECGGQAAPFPGS